MNVFSLVFGKDKEYLAGKFFGGKTFECRPQQVEMLRAVQKAISQDRHLIVEAGTGVGKSMAYLLPFIKWAYDFKKKVVISTYTKTLQEQLIKKDIPRLKKLLGIDLRFALCLGAANYLCLRRLRQNSVSGFFDIPRDKKDMFRIQKWAQNTQTGLRLELDFSPQNSVWGRVCRDGELCLGRKCLFRKGCFYYKAKAQEYKAHILVTNHHLFFANVASGGAVLPSFEAVVFDEAHTIEQVATSYLGLDVSNFQIKYFLDSLFNFQTGKGFLRGVKGVGRPKIEEVRGKLEKVRNAAKDFFSETVRRFGRESGTIRIRESLAYGFYFQESLAKLAKSLKNLIEFTERDEDKVELGHFISRAYEFRHVLETILYMKKPGYVYWLEIQSRARGLRYTFSAAPIDISEEFKAKVLNDVKLVVLTSATLSVNGSFSFLKKSLGFERGAADELILDSPFNYERNVLLYLPNDIPDPALEYERYRKSATEQIKKILPLMKGRTFILFTSFSMMNKAYKEIKESFTDLRVLKQGEAPRYKLLETFKRNSNAVLLGTNTFWQGIDIPGKALECVIINKLPFAVPDDPITEAKMEMLAAQGKNPFIHYQIPQAVIMLRQGFGRLIRTKSDRGLVVILDPRIKTKYYGRNFLRALPPCKRIFTLEYAENFFASQSPVEESMVT